MIKLRAEFPDWVTYDHSDPVGLSKKLPPITNKKVSRENYIEWGGGTAWLPFLLEDNPTE